LTGDEQEAKERLFEFLIVHYYAMLGKGFIWETKENEFILQGELAISPEEEIYSGSGQNILDEVVTFPRLEVPGLGNEQDDSDASLLGSNSNKLKKRISPAEFQKRLQAGEPEAISLWRELLGQVQKEAEPVISWFEKLQDDPLTRTQIDYLEKLTNSENPFLRNIGKNIDVESFVEMMKNVSGEISKVDLPDLDKTSKKRGRRPLTAREKASRRKMVNEWEKLIVNHPHKSPETLANDVGVPYHTLRDWKKKYC
jgi:hypothetical protein